jgi:hypothetical protein
MTGASEPQPCPSRAQQLDRILLAVITAEAAPAATWKLSRSPIGLHSTCDCDCDCAATRRALRWIEWLSHLYWAYMAFSINEFRGECCWQCAGDTQPGCSLTGALNMRNVTPRRAPLASRLDDGVRSGSEVTRRWRARLSWHCAVRRQLPCGPPLTPLRAVRRRLHHPAQLGLRREAPV